MESDLKRGEATKILSVHLPQGSPIIWTHANATIVPNKSPIQALPEPVLLSLSNQIGACSFNMLPMVNKHWFAITQPEPWSHFGWWPTTRLKRDLSQQNQNERTFEISFILRVRLVRFGSVCFQVLMTGSCFSNLQKFWQASRLNGSSISLIGFTQPPWPILDF